MTVKDWYSNLTAQAREDFLEGRKLYRQEHYTHLKQKDYELREKRWQQAIDYLGACCIECGYADARALQFDHLPENADKVVRGKTKHGSNRVVNMRRSWEAIRAELDTCELVCANCHVIRTRERGQFVPRKYETGV